MIMRMNEWDYSIESFFNSNFSNTLSRNVDNIKEVKKNFIIILMIQFQ